MDLFEYWPTKKHINECIRTEAEELAEHTLLAVHEPMRLIQKGESETISCWDEDLLNTFLQTERPIPIIGRSGVGKSHLIRWLHAQLKVHPDTKDWHIVRIPKNSSLRQVLELLLTDLEGEVFEQARKRVKTVGEKLNTKEVAELLLTFMGQQLRNQFEKVQETIKYYRQKGSKEGLSKDEINRIKAIQSHCNERSLPVLINDPYFQEFLLDPGHCIFQFAKRLTSGANDDELSDNDYQVSGKDLNFTYNLNDLSTPAANYVSQNRLNTDEGQRDIAAQMLNLVLGEATRTAFQQLFQFSGNNFQELFKHIRQDLHSKNKTLVVLVEDMAAISAIEDVLIDSLLEEGLYEGKETMCKLHSAIAVTDGYPGYLRRQGTIKTRAKAEWWIEEIQKDESEQVLQQRIIDFCSRYINAARHGGLELQKEWDDKKDGQWPPIWENDEIDRQYLDAFGRAQTNISLYPLSPLAINALSDKLCRNEDNKLRFNPRQVINQILLRILRESRIEAENEQFPPGMLANIHVPGSLRSELAVLGLKDIERVESLCAIWGFGAQKFDDLKEILSSDIANEFSLKEFASSLKSGVVYSPPKVKEEQEKTEKKPKVEKPTQADLQENKIKDLFKKLDLWFQGDELLPQKEAKILRSELANLYVSNAEKSWSGVATLPAIKSGTRVNITLPFAIGNRSGSLVEFCSEKEFKDQSKSILYHDSARALFRFNFYNSDESVGWNYPEGENDFLRYQNFVALWVPSVLQKLRDNSRDQLDAVMDNHVKTARLLSVFKENCSQRECLNKLLITSDKLKDSYAKPVCEAISEERDNKLSGWQTQKKDWMDLISSNEHAIEGDLALLSISRALKQPLPSRINQLVNKSLRELEQYSINSIIELFNDCDSTDEFNQVLESLELLIKQLRSTGKYPSGVSIVTSSTLIKQIGKLVDSGYFDQVRKMSALYDTDAIERKWQVLNEIDGDKLYSIVKVISNWTAVFDVTLPKLQNENAQWGGDRISEAKEEIDSTLESLQRNLLTLQGDSNANT